MMKLIAKIDDFIIVATNSFVELILIYLAVLVMGSAAFSFFEGKDMAASFYWACVTATSTGYGDISPATLGGRITAIILMNVSILFILPLMIGRVATKLIENRDAFTHEEQVQMLNDIAAIKRAMKIEDETAG